MPNVSDHCQSYAFHLPDDSAVYDFLTNINKSYSQFFVGFLIVSGPILLVMNGFVMFILSRKELRSPYNTVFVIMALVQVLSIINQNLWVWRLLVNRSDCAYSAYTPLWKQFEVCVVIWDKVSNVHLSWLAVIVTAVRVRSVRQQSKEPSNTFMLLLCGLSFLFIVILSIPQYLSYEVRWTEKQTRCKGEEPRQVMVPLNIEIDLLFADDCLLLRIHSFTTALFFNVLPCLALLVLTTILLLRLGKIRRDRNHILAGPTSRQSADSVRTSRLLVAIVISTLIIDIPQAIVAVLVGLWPGRFRTSFAYNLESFFVTLLILASFWNLSVHLLMSRRFREVSKKYLCCPCCHFSSTKSKTKIIISSSS